EAFCMIASISRTVLRNVWSLRASRAFWMILAVDFFVDRRAIVAAERIAPVSWCQSAEPPRTDGRRTDGLAPRGAGQARDSLVPRSLGGRESTPARTDLRLHVDLESCPGQKPDRPDLCDPLTRGWGHELSASGATAKREKPWASIMRTMSTAIARFAYGA